MCEVKNPLFLFGILVEVHPDVVKDEITLAA
jgi:hypothetical protein